jgi:hypothetical protein
MRTDACQLVNTSPSHRATSLKMKTAWAWNYISGLATAVEDKAFVVTHNEASVIDISLYLIDKL